MSEATPGGEGVSVSAPAKLTLSLRVTGVRDDGYHLLDAEMVSIDLADTLTFGTGTGISVVDDVRGHLGVGGVPTGPENLVARALTLVGRRASVRIVKRIPAGAGLGGGSSDAPFCVRGGHARVTGAGERLEPLPFEDRRFVLLLSPLSVDTDAVYRRWDDRRARHGAEEHHAGPGGNDLEAAALEVAPQLAHWRRELAVVTGRTPRLAGSGSTWFVEGDAEGLGIAGLDFLVMGDQRAVLVEVSTLPATSSR